MKAIKRVIVFFGAIFLIILLLLSALFLFIRNLKTKELLVGEIKKELGIDVSIKELTLSPLLTAIRAKGITIHNPAGFDEKELAYIDSLDLIWDPMEMIIHKKPAIYLIMLNLERLNIIKKDGRVNLKELIPVKESGISDGGDEDPFRFDLLILSIGEINYIEHNGAARKLNKYQIGIKNQVFFNLEDEDQLVRLIIYKAIQNTDIGKMINLTITPIASNVFNTFDAAIGTAKSGARSLFDAASMPFKMIFNK
jgi:uncharacterized protein involved in outer membrane biogenesis